MKKITFVLLMSILCIATSYGQWLMGLHTVDDDSFGEWTIEIEIDSTTTEEGKLELTWGIGRDFTDWRYSVGNIDGEIVQKFDNNPALWELRQDGDIVSISRTWPNDPTQWKVELGDQSITIKSRNGDIADIWENKNADRGDLVIYTEVEGDPRDWLVDDFMSDDIPFSMRMAAVFISIFSSVPKI